MYTEHVLCILSMCYVYGECAIYTENVLYIRRMCYIYGECAIYTENVLVYKPSIWLLEPPGMLQCVYDWATSINFDWCAVTLTVLHNAFSSPLPTRFVLPHWRRTVQLTHVRFTSLSPVC